MKLTANRSRRRHVSQQLRTAKAALAEAHATIAMLAQQLADKREIIRRLTI